VVDVLSKKATGCGCTGVETGTTALWGLLLLALRRRR